jgi:TetR/AcrR family transcriptional regulator
MVSQQRTAARGRTKAEKGAASKARLLRAAADEFAARGFDGAKVDRIARRAGVNKAMVYYHFHNKAALYREILAGLFQGLAAAVEGRRAEGGCAEAQLRAFIHTVSRVATTEPHFPAIWLREMAEGGRHVDAGVVGSIRGILVTLKNILDQGRHEGAFKPAHPLVTQMGIVAPLLLFAASAPARDRFSQLAPGFAVVPQEAVVGYVETATLAALRTSPPVPAFPPSRRPRR